MIILFQRDEHKFFALLEEVIQEMRAIRRILNHHPRTTHARVAFGGLMNGTQVVGTTLQAVFDPLQADGTITPGAVVEAPPVWTSDNPAVATVDAGGVVTGVSEGIATITGTGGVFQDPDGTLTAPLTAAGQDTVTAVAPPVVRTVSAQVSFKAI